MSDRPPLEVHPLRKIDREISLAVVAGSMTIISFMRDWSHHLVGDMEKLPPLIATMQADNPSRVDYLYRMRLCFCSSGIASVVIAGLAAWYLWGQGRAFSRVCAVFMAITAIVCGFAWFWVSRLRIWDLV